MSGQQAGAFRRHRGRWFAAAAAAVVAVALVVGGIARSSHERHHLAAGEHLDGVMVFVDQLTEHRAEVQTAFGSLPVTIGTGREIGSRDDRVRAPDGASLVRVTWSPGLIYDGPPVWPTSTPRDRRDPGTTLTLVTGGHRYLLADAVVMSDGGSSAIIVVAGDGSDARVESRFGGRTFTSAPGPNTPRTVRSQGYAGCQDTSKRTYSWVDCTLPVHRGVYVAGLGVAPAGKEWLVVQGASATRYDQNVRVRDAHDDSKRAEYAPSGPPAVTVTVDGVSAKPRVAGSDTVIGDSVRVATRAWLVPAQKSATVRLRYRLPTRIVPAHSYWHGAPSTHLVDVSTTTTYPGV
ncbi:hypothetical protein [Flexivirga oryzae]|uniref:Uncharacterized protein n=1 Tax=Flexivirga oryzae TaxID=1794944 RepID=A0A839N5S2_9MICO|nr:hypothetical protein [Flexivirga oryzae]MBB2892627.1 hypothetical protein [Flexivirga oryzae]MBB2894520.1 hypothetical protein [Flexivirga oryzae]